jgi:2'-5' RNA ligase
VDPYAGQPGRRLFVAVPLPATTVEAVTEVVTVVREQPLPPGAHDVRWVRLDGLHLTMRFLGPTTSDQEARTVEAVARVAASNPPIEAELGGAGTFPPSGRPRTLWIGLTAGVDALTALAAAVGRELVAVGWPPDDRLFRAHLTLARSDGIGVGRLVADRLAAVMTDRRIPVAIEAVGLFESVTGGGPARYVPIVERALATPDPSTPVYHRHHP